MTFHVGQKVVCVDDNRSISLIKRGAVYVVTSTRGNSGQPGYIMIDNGGGIADGGWYPHRFRPVIERKTDISALTALLNPKNHKRKRENATAVGA